MADMKKWIESNDGRRKREHRDGRKEGIDGRTQETNDSRGRLLSEVLLEMCEARRVLSEDTPEESQETSKTPPDSFRKLHRLRTGGSLQPILPSGGDTEDLQLRQQKGPGAPGPRPQLHSLSTDRAWAGELESDDEFTIRTSRR